MHTSAAAANVPSVQATHVAYAAIADPQQELVADLLFDHDIGLGLEIVRYNIGGSNTDPRAVNSMRPGGAVPSLLLPNGTYNWTLVSTA